MNDAGIYARESAYLGRWIQIGVAGGRVISVSFPSSPDGEAVGDHALIDRFDRYFEGARDDFQDVAVALTVPTDQRAVLETLRKVPFGEQVSLARLAGMTPGLDPDEEDDLELVRRALAGNPAPIILPDHRVRDAPSGAPPAVVEKLQAVETR